MKLNKNLSGTQITDELIRRTNVSALRLVHDTILSDGTFEIWTGIGKTGTQLTLTTDYVLGSLDARLTTEASQDVFTTVAIVNGTFHNVDLYVTYKTVGDFVEGVDVLPVGMVAPFGGTTAPTGWLICDGTAVSRTTYSQLFAYLGTTWGAGNGTTTFNLPDMSGAFLRGTGTGVVNGRNKVGPAIGAKQEDEMQGHWHGVRLNSTAPDPSFQTSAQLGNAPNSVPTIRLGYTAVGAIADNLGNGDPRTGTESRPYNVGVLYCIKF
jgi:microcystin-dependent protein